MPDAELYLDWYCRSVRGEAVAFPYPEEGFTAAMYVDRTVRGFGHRATFDFETLAKLLTEAGFREVRQVAFRQGSDPRLLIDAERRRVESLYVEATKSGPLAS